MSQLPLREAVAVAIALAEMRRNPPKDPRVLAGGLTLEPRFIKAAVHVEGVLADAAIAAYEAWTAGQVKS